MDPKPIAQGPKNSVPLDLDSLVLGVGGWGFSLERGVHRQVVLLYVPHPIL